MDSTKTTKITQSQKRSKPNDSDSENDNENDNGTWPRYLIIEPVHEGELAKLSLFAVSKGISGIAGEPKSLKRLRSGTYLVEVTRKSHADNLLRSKTTGNGTYQSFPAPFAEFQKRSDMVQGAGYSELD